MDIQARAPSGITVAVRDQDPFMPNIERVKHQRDRKKDPEGGEDQDSLYTLVLGDRVRLTGTTREFLGLADGIWHQFGGG